MLPNIRPLGWKYLGTKVCLLMPVLQALHKVPWYLVEQEGQVPALQRLFSIFRLPFPVEICMGAYLLLI